MKIVLGLDPGTVRTGFAVLAWQKEPQPVPAEKAGTSPAKPSGRKKRMKSRRGWEFDRPGIQTISQVRKTSAPVRSGQAEGKPYEKKENLHGKNIFMTQKRRHSIKGKEGSAISSFISGAERVSLLEMGVFCADSHWKLEQRLVVIGRELEKIYRERSVSETALEQVFFGKNPDSAFKLGQIFGLCVYQAIGSGSSLSAYAARYVKQAVTGSGRADKQAVRAFVLNIFKMEDTDEITHDATDALAVALCHIYRKQTIVL